MQLSKDKCQKGSNNLEPFSLFTFNIKIMSQDKPSIIPFRVNKQVDALNSLVKNEDYFVTKSKEGYMCTVEYIALSVIQSASEMQITVYDFNVDPKGSIEVLYLVPIENKGTYFSTKLRMMPGELLNVKAMGAKDPVIVHVSGYYELIP